MNSVKVSIIVCTYNQEKTLSLSLESVLAQEVDFAYEIILADDCSQDNTPEICEHYAQLYPDRIKLVLNKQNKGLVNNYFDCIMMCQGKYIADLAGDDIWIDTQKLAKQVKLLDADESIVLCHANWQYLNQDNDVLHHFHINHSDRAYVLDGKDMIADLMQHNNVYFVHLCTSMYRRDCAQKLLTEKSDILRDKRWKCEDFQLIIYLATLGKIAYMPDCVLYYRIGHESITSTKDHTKIASMAISVIQMTHAIAVDLGMDEGILTKYYLYDLQYALIHAVYAQRKDIRQDVLNTWHELQLRKPLKSKITEFLSSNALSWKATVLLHNAL